MTWTVGRRIALALAIELALLAVVAVVGASALGRTADTYENALTVRRSTVVPAVRVQSELRGASMEQLRFLLGVDERYERRRDSIVNVARVLAIAVGDTVKTPEAREKWRRTVALIAQWNDAMLVHSWTRVRSA